MLCDELVAADWGADDHNPIRGRGSISTPGWVAGRRELGDARWRNTPHAIPTHELPLVDLNAALFPRDLTNHVVCFAGALWACEDVYVIKVSHYKDSGRKLVLNLANLTLDRLRHTPL